MFDRLFKPAHIAELGTFQDGGLRHNNPVDLALWECGKIWNTSISPDVVVSLGTGTEEDLRTPRAPHFRHVFNDGFIPRLCRSFMSSLDGERAWRDLQNRLDDKLRADFFRFNITLSEDGSKLDDVGQMEQLKRCVQLHPTGNDDRIHTASALLIGSFFFELQCLPVFEAGRYLCQGWIRCRNDFDSIFHSLTNMHGSSGEFQVNTERLGQVNPKDLCRSCGTYRKRIAFYVKELEDTVTIKVAFRERVTRKVSGFPNCMRWFIEQQHLAADFGSLHHDIASRPCCLACQEPEPSDVQRLLRKRKACLRRDTKRKRPRLHLELGAGSTTAA